MRHTDIGTLNGLRIAVASTEPWNAPFLSKHNVALKLAERGNRVAFVNPWRHAGDIVRGRRLPPGFHNTRHPNLRCVTPLRLPKADGCAVAWTFTRALLRWQVDAALAGPPEIIFCFAPHYHCLADLYPRALLVYYCVDHQPDRDAEAKALAKAQLVLASSRRLADRLRQHNANTHYVPHGCDFEALERVNGPLPAALDEAASSPRPRVGYVGAISHRVDLDLLMQVVDACPDLTFVLVGPYEPSALGVDPLTPSELANLRQRENVFLTGPLPPEQIGAAIRLFDVCMIPYDLDHPINMDSNPIKVLQYLALGKPVVSTPLPELTNMADLLYLATDADGFAAALRRALRDDGPAVRKRRMDYAGRNTWDTRMDTLESLLQATVSRVGCPLRSHVAR